MSSPQNSISCRVPDCRNLHLYHKSEVLVVLTDRFCKRFLPPCGDRTVDQMNQAARTSYRQEQAHRMQALEDDSRLLKAEVAAQRKRLVGNQPSPCQRMNATYSGKPVSSSRPSRTPQLWLQYDVSRCENPPPESTRCSHSTVTSRSLRLMED